ncbi:DedA family protein [Pseudonocardia parietis]|uniref:Membrane protein DedA with SNARE-associated domain n=1 Tax=Pseudonocardia parietis TaxID=570936 RepID=A0ABS4VNB5_9PSEU|nr:VTT domain-containing protein [Pseudonocardia parietis]MBP2365415.1 membrane protein DedA with SNARE-associated domain [Pseudonocardia parietis]
MIGLSDTVAALLAAIPAAPIRSLLVIGFGAFLEGPIVTVAAAALAGAGQLPWWGVWLAALVADAVGDTLLYALGRHGDRPAVARVLARLGLTDARRETLTREVHTHLPRIVIGAKLVDIGAIPAYLAAGLANVGYRRFLTWIIPATAVRAAVLVGIGYAAGDRLATDLESRPWLLLVGGVAVGVALVVGRLAIVRATDSKRRAHVR